jgi:hypothetical protein
MSTYDHYYEQIKDSTLELLEDGKVTKTFLLRYSPNSYMMSCFIVFAPFGIVIGGDLRVTNHGLTIYGYDLPWFASKLESDYLAGKCLEEKWDCVYARKAFLEYADDIQATIDQETAEIRKDRAEWYEIEESAVTPEMMAEITDDLSYPVKKWRFGSELTMTGTMADAIRELAKEPYNFETPEILYNSFPGYKNEDTGKWQCPFDSEDVSRGYGYLEGEIGWLFAIQRRFSECYQAMQVKS